MSIALGYWIEQGVVSGITLCLLVFSFLQLWAEKHGPLSKYHQHTQAVTPGSLKWTWHRLSLVLSLLFAAVSVDPRGVHGFYSDGVIEILLDNVTACVLVGLFAALFLSLRPVLVLLDTPPPAAMKPLFALAVAVTVAVANTVGIITLHKGYTPSRVNAVWLCFIAVALTVVVGVFNCSTSRLRAEVGRYIGMRRNGADPRFSAPRFADRSDSVRSPSASPRYYQSDSKYKPNQSGRSPIPTIVVVGSDSSPTPSQTLTSARRSARGNVDVDKIREVMQRLFLLQVIATVLTVCALAAVLYVAIGDFSDDPSTTGRVNPSPETYTLNANTTLLWLQLAAAVVFNWHSWIPITHSYCHCWRRARRRMFDVRVSPSPASGHEPHSNRSPLSRGRDPASQQRYSFSDSSGMVFGSPYKFDSAMLSSDSSIDDFLED